MTLGPSQIQHGIPPTLVEAPPAALESRPPISQRDLHEQKMKTLLDQMHIMAEQLSSVQENLVAFPAAAAPFLGQETSQLSLSEPLLRE
eukprot:4181491-Pyramimonas_sp.AAC.1